MTWCRAACVVVLAAACACEPPDATGARPSTAPTAAPSSGNPPARQGDVGPSTPAAPSIAPSSTPPSAQSPREALLARNTERAKADTLDRLPRLRRSPLVQRAFPPSLQRILEGADEVVLHSVAWGGDDTALDALLDGTASARKDVFGSLALPPEDGRAVAAWLYDAVTRPFAGMKCNNPHHAFLFRKGAALLAVEVCFECGTLAMRGAGAYRASVRLDPAFRDFLKGRLQAAGIPDLSSDLRP